MIGRYAEMKNKRKSIHKILIVFAALIVIYIGKNIYDIWSFSTVDQKCRADVAVILGAAVYDDEPSPVYRERINHGITLYNEGYVDRIIVTGGAPEGSEVSEAEVAKLYLLEQGIPEAAVLTENTSTITQENLENSRVIMEENNYETAYEIRQPEYKNPVSCKRNILLYRISVVSIIFLRNRIADISQRVLLLYRN